MTATFSDGEMPDEYPVESQYETARPGQEAVSPLTDEPGSYVEMARETQVEAEKMSPSEGDEGQIVSLPTPEMELPPEARGETHGGPLGCCLGTIVGLFLMALVITATSIVLANGGFFGGGTIPLLALGVLLGGYFGWRIGKRIYREYESPVVKERPRQTVRARTRRRVPRSASRT